VRALLYANLTTRKLSESLPESLPTPLPAPDRSYIERLENRGTTSVVPPGVPTYAAAATAPFL